MRELTQARRAGDERGNTLIPVLIVFSMLLLVGLSLVSRTQADFRVAGAVRDMTQAKYLAEASIQDLAARQNDLSRNPRHLFATTTYQVPGVDAWFVDAPILDPETGAAMGTASRRVVGGKNPLLDIPPYRVRSTATVRGAVRTIEAELAPLSLLEYALWTENSVSIAPFITYTGKVYSASFITLTGAPVTFRRRVEYVTTITGQSYGTYDEGIKKLTSPKPTLTSLVDLDFYRTATQAGGSCGGGYGLWVGTGMPHTAIFQRSSGVYQIDFGQFDFSGAMASPKTAIRYAGQTLFRYDDPTKPIIDFNGIIYVNGTLYVWGINGGRSVEDAAWRDDLSGNPVATRYPGPLGTGKNYYSNNELDAGEDGTGGGTVNGVLDPRKLGRSLTVVTASGRDIWIDHNIFMGQDPAGIPVRTALISGRAIHVSAYSPKTVRIEAALLGLGSSTCSGAAGGNSWLPCGDHAGHPDNWWAKVPFTAPAKYIYDTDRDGTLESNNGAFHAYDRNENSMLTSWSLEVFGNRIFQGVPSSGHWASDSHLRFYTYDETLVIYEPPCYPVLPEYGMVAGSVVEIR